ncbi:MAG: hypothetical protein A2749_01100 [Parcubacteria group bacterium RIFCSPHIGHO2_01_FULL_45_26]|nr:MAG: hypothetical protein A2749_01100 [Parcubacteria group bacterium RIFCSPHIGHO2_01_FULL_45_26]
MADIKNFARNNTGDFADTALRAAATGFSGGLGAGLRRVTAAATDAAVDRGAQGFAERLKNRKRGQPESATKGAEKEKEGGSKKKMVGTVFWLVFSLTTLKDISDVVADFSVILTFLTPATGIITSFVVAVYFYVNEVEVSTNKIIAYIISVALEFIPFLNAIPTTTIVLLLTKWMENNKEKVAKLSGGISKVVNKFKTPRRVAT